MSKTKASVNRAFLELERRCHALLTELKNSIETLDGQDLRRSIQEIGDRYGMVV